MKGTIKLLAISIVAMFGAVAVAQATNIINIDRTTRWMKGGFYSGEAATASTANKVTDMLATTVDWNFASSTIVCTDSRPITITGAAVGDPCMVGTPAAPEANSHFACFVSAADTAYLRHCASGTAADPGDAGYSIRIISAQ